mgnify:CR=1 FL=1
MEKTANVTNRVANSSTELFNLEDIRPSGERVVFDLKDWLHEGLILQEKKFRHHVKSEDWTKYAGKHVAVTCSTDAIVPTWAFMAVVAELTPHARTVVLGDREVLEQELFRRELALIDWEDYVGKKVVIKGCSDVAVPDFAYGEVVRSLAPLAKLIMYGEPCSNVPVYKQRKQKAV